MPILTKYPTEHLSDNKKKCLAACKLSANIREGRHLQLLAAPEVERLQRRQLADRLGQRLQPSLMNPKTLSLTCIETPQKKIPRAVSIHCCSYEHELLISEQAINKGTGY